MRPIYRVHDAAYCAGGNPHWPHIHMRTTKIHDPMMSEPYRTWQAEGAGAILELVDESGVLAERLVMLGWFSRKSLYEVAEAQGKAWLRQIENLD